jgi:hypothetical protein
MHLRAVSFFCHFLFFFVYAFVLLQQFSIQFAAIFLLQFLHGLEQQHLVRVAVTEQLEQQQQDLAAKPKLGKSPARQAAPVPQRPSRATFRLRRRRQPSRPRNRRLER